MAARGRTLLYAIPGPVRVVHFNEALDTFFTSTARLFDRGRLGRARLVSARGLAAQREGSGRADGRGSDRWEMTNEEIAALLVEALILHAKAIKGPGGYSFTETLKKMEVIRTRLVDSP